MYASCLHLIEQALESLVYYHCILPLIAPHLWMSQEGSPDATFHSVKVAAGLPRFLDKPMLWRVGPVYFFRSCCLPIRQPPFAFWVFPGRVSPDGKSFFLYKMSKRQAWGAACEIWAWDATDCAAGHDGLWWLPSKLATDTHSLRTRARTHTHTWVNMDICVSFSNRAQLKIITQNCDEDKAAAKVELRVCPTIYILKHTICCVHIH